MEDFCEISVNVTFAHNYITYAFAPESRPGLLEVFASEMFKKEYR